MRGRSIPLSRARRIVVDLLHFAHQVPTVPVQRRMQIGSLVAARAECRDRPRWTAIFLKAYALAARDFPALRRAYVKFPWPQLYEYPVCSASIVFERALAGEPALFSYLMKDPARLPLQDLNRKIAALSTAPVDEVADFRRSLRLAGLPRPLRRLLWWIGLNVGRQRGNYFGTFGLSVYSALQAESLHPLAPVTTLLNYGVIDEDGSLNVRIIYDHRVLDGAVVARVLARLQDVLNGPILAELEALEKAPILRQAAPYQPAFQRRRA
jgi:hypothetical protein